VQYEAAVAKRERATNDMLKDIGVLGAAVAA